MGNERSTSKPSAAQRLARGALAAWLCLSIAMIGWSGLQLVRNPVFSLVAERSAEAFVASLERELAKATTPEHVTDKLQELLLDEPRNWLAIDSVIEIAEDHKVILPVSLTEQLSEQRKSDKSWGTSIKACFRCGRDASNCSLQNVLQCHGPVALTPIGDVKDLATAGYAYAKGEDVDELGVALSAVGLTATGATLLTAGTTTPVLLAVKTLKTARKLSLLSSRFTRMLTRAAHEAIDWSALGKPSILGDVSLAIRPGAAKPLLSTLSDLGRIGDSVGINGTLHLMRYIDDATDARRLAKASSVMKERIIGTVELLGKSRTMKLAVRINETVFTLLGGIAGIFLSLTAFIGNLGQHWLTRSLRKRLRSLAR